VKNIVLQTQRPTSRGMIYRIYGFNVASNGGPIILWLMELIIVVGASKIIGLANDNVVMISYNISMLVTLFI
jgi:hypothetical protein